jgi:hypothetical protein
MDTRVTVRAVAEMPGALGSRVGEAVGFSGWVQYMVQGIYREKGTGCRVERTRYKVRRRRGQHE